jgi:hypothetical protein
MLSNLFSKLNIPLLTYSKLLRIGKIVSDTSPVKVFFNSSADALQVLQNIKSAKKSNMLPPPHISIVRDKTKWERDSLHAAYTDLERRKADGETDLIVKYVNGIPKAVKPLSKN